MQLYLASASPRRRELLDLLDVPFTVQPVEVPEHPVAGEQATTYVTRLAREKASAGVARLPAGAMVLGADTLIARAGAILEKPRDEEHFRTMFRQLSDARHEVLTAVSLACGTWQETRLVTTQVWFRAITEAEMSTYWATGEPADKAGGYGIQGRGGKFVRHLAGSYSAVVGLPLCETEALLQAGRQWQQQKREQAE